MDPKLKISACILTIMLLVTAAAAASTISGCTKGCALLEEGTTTQAIVYTFTSTGASPTLRNIQVDYQLDGGAWSAPVTMGATTFCVTGATCVATLPVTLPAGSAGKTVVFRVTGAVYDISGNLIAASVSGTTGPYTVIPSGLTGPPSGAPACIQNGVCDSNRIPAENCGNCPQDCKCPKDCPCTTCGSNGCEVGETPTNCPSDCVAVATTGPRPITISGIEICPGEPADGKLQKSIEYDLRIGFTTSTTDLEELRVYYCLTATASSPLPVGSGACKSGTSICPMTNQVACPSGECNPENCSGVAPCVCDAKIKIPWAVPTAGIVITGKSLGVEQNTANPQNYEIIAPIEQPIEGVLETQLLVYGGYQTFRCENIAPGRFPGCGYDFSCNGAVTDQNPVVSCKDCNDCKVKCAQACGESTTCKATASETCEACCDKAGSTCGKGTYGAYDFWNCLLVPCYNSVQESCACKQACRGECEANTSFCNTIELLRLIAGIAVAIMLVIQALRYVMSDEPMDRQNAKEGIWYVIIGGVLIMIASGLVGYLFMEGLPC